MSSVSKSESENNSKVKENADEGVTGLYNLTPPHVLDTYDRGRRMRQNAMPYGTTGRILGGPMQQSEIYAANMRLAAKKQEEKERERRRRHARNIRAKSAERRRSKGTGGRKKKKKKRTRKKKRRN
jgi:hypothetical protein